MGRDPPPSQSTVVLSPTLPRRLLLLGSLMIYSLWHSHTLSSKRKLYKYYECILTKSQQSIVCIYTSHVHLSTFTNMPFFFRGTYSAIHGVAKSQTRLSERLN